MAGFVKDKEKEFQKKQEEFTRREAELVQQAQRQEAELRRGMEEEKQRIQLTLEQSLRKSIASDFENKVRLLEEANLENEERLKTSGQKELEFLRKEQDLRTREA